MLYTSFAGERSLALTKVSGKEGSIFTWSPPDGSKSGETQAVVDMAHKAKRKGLKVMAISHTSSTLASLASINLDLIEPVDGISLYSRESQIQMLKIIDEIGRMLLEAQEPIKFSTH